LIRVDPAFGNPTKPIGPFYSEEDANIISAEKHYIMKEDAGRGWRRVSFRLRSPTIMLRSIPSNGYGTPPSSSLQAAARIPVVEHEDGSFEGVAAVIDKDYAAELLAEQVGVDTLLILTEVEKVAINYNRPDQKNLDSMSVEEAERYIAEGHFAPGACSQRCRRL